MAKKFNFATETEYRDYVLDKANDFLDKCKIYNSREERKGLVENINMSIAAKQWLMDIFSKSEGYNGKGQVVLPVAFTRDINLNEIDRFVNFILNYAERVLEDVKSEFGDVREMIQKRSQYRRYFDFAHESFLEYDDVVINGKDLNYYRSVYNKITGIVMDLKQNHKSHYGRIVTNESYTDYETAKEIARFIAENPVQYITDSDSLSKVNEKFGLRLNNGVKMSRAINKMIKASKLYSVLIANDDTEHYFNSAYARYCDAINPLTIKRWTVISVNFVDYLTMSNGYRWTSCLNPDKRGYFTEGMWSDGFNSRRVLDYALDGSTIVFYTIDSNYDGDEYELQKKETRQLFHFNGNTLMQNRLYPQGDDARAGIYPQYREIIERILCEGMGVPNLWSAPHKGLICYSDGIATMPYGNCCTGDFVDFFDIASHGCDEYEFYDHVNWVTLNGTHQRPVMIGSVNAVDIITGEKLSEHYHRAITKYYTGR